MTTPIRASRNLAGMLVLALAGSTLLACPACRSLHAGEEADKADPATAEFFEARSGRCWPSTAWSVTALRSRRGACGSTRAGHAQGAANRAGGAAGQGRREPADRGDPLRRRGADAAPRESSKAEIAALTDWVKRVPLAGARVGRAPPRRSSRRPRRSDRRSRRRTGSSGRSGRSASRSRPRSGTRPGRSRRSTASSWRRLEASGLTPVAAGRQADADPPRDLRPDRPAADARGDRRLPRGRRARRLREGRRPAARVAALRRALGPALARRRPLRRGPGPHLPAPALPQRLALSRLGDQGASTHDMPYDRFVIEQIAGDLLDGPGPPASAWPALGFFALGPVYYGDAKKLDQYDDRIDTLDPRLPRADRRLRPLPRPQVRPDPDHATTTPWPASSPAPTTSKCPLRRRAGRGYDKAQAAIKQGQGDQRSSRRGRRLKQKVPKNQIENAAGDAKKLTAAGRARRLKKKRRPSTR